MKPLFAIAMGGALAVLAACQTTDSGAIASGARYVVSAERSPFFERGPAQDYGPDFTLVRGQEVEMVERSFGFSRVKSDVGKIGWVSNDDLEPAPPRADPTPAPVDPFASSSSREPSAAAPSIDYGDVVTDLPSPEEEPKPVTGFRY